MPTLRDWILQEPHALCLTSGFFGFFAHAGFVQALDDEGLLRPEQLAGSSAGALVASCVAMGVPPRAIADRFERLAREDFWDPFFRTRRLPRFGLLEGRLFERELGAIVGSASPTFADCQTPLAVSAFDCLRGRTVVLDQGPLLSAVHASCAFPGLFQVVAREGRYLLDGGILDRPGLANIEPGRRVLLHHLESKSPWRKGRASWGAELVRRPGVLNVVLGDLPRSGPNKLDAGREAFRVAYERTRRTLDAPIADGVVRPQEPA